MTTIPTPRRTGIRVVHDPAALLAEEMAYCQRELVKARADNPRGQTVKHLISRLGGLDFARLAYAAACTPAPCPHYPETEE